MTSQTVPPTDNQEFKHVRKLGQFGPKPLTRACSTLFSITAHILCHIFILNQTRQMLISVEGRGKKELDLIKMEY